MQLPGRQSNPPGGKSFSLPLLKTRRISLSGLLERLALPITALYGMSKIYYPFALPLSMREIQPHAAVWYLTSPAHSANSLNQNQIRSNQKSLNLINEILIIIVSRTNKVRQWGRFSVALSPMINITTWYTAHTASDLGLVA